MSIDARITGITYLPDKTARLTLEPRGKATCAGQSALIVVNPTPWLSALLEREIWGGDSEIMLGEQKIAERLGYIEIKLCDNPHLPNRSVLPVRTSDDR